MLQTLALLLTLISFTQAAATLGPLKVKTEAGRSAYVGFAARDRAATIFLSADAAAPERTEPLPLAFIVDGRRLDLPEATRSKETGDARRDVLQRWTARLTADQLCEVGSGSTVSIEAGELTFQFGAHAEEVQEFVRGLCD